MIGNGTTSATRSDAIIVYKNGETIINATAAIGTTTSGSESTFQDNSSATDDGYLSTPWIYTNAIEATGERGTNSTAITVGDDDNFGANDEIHLITKGTSALIVNSNQHVGIGINPINADFEVAFSSNSNSFSLSNIGYLNTGGAGTSSYSGRFAIYADGRISGTAFIAHSDERIKNIIGQSNGKSDLDILNKIQITDYTMKDQVKHDNKIIKKVIAQQVKEVYPQAVTTNATEVIPNIYQTATIDEKGWVTGCELPVTSCQLKVSEKVQIVFENRKELLEVLEVKENAFRVKQATIRSSLIREIGNRQQVTGNRQQTTVFVYGKQVNDFHTVDYEAISMLNVSATQQLAKEMEQLKLENEQLKIELQEIQNLKQQNAEMKAMLEQIQAQLSNHSNQ